MLIKNLTFFAITFELLMKFYYVYFKQ